VQFILHTVGFSDSEGVAVVADVLNDDAADLGGGRVSSAAGYAMLIGFSYLKINSTSKQVHRKIFCLLQSLKQNQCFGSSLWFKLHCF